MWKAESVENFMKVFREHAVGTFNGYERDIAEAVNKLYHEEIDEGEAKKLADKIKVYVKNLEEEGNNYDT